MREPFSGRFPSPEEGREREGGREAGRECTSVCSTGYTLSFDDSVQSSQELI